MKWGGKSICVAVCSLISYRWTAASDGSTAPFVPLGPGILLNHVIGIT
ncbi:hypothetical protein BH20ACT22_BH20ACT22_11170 [soil metagenome]